MTEIDEKAYKAINVFVEREDLEDVLSQMFAKLKQLPKDIQIKFFAAYRKYIKINGFRNPVMAPLPFQVNALADAFEKEDEVIPFTLSTLTKTMPELAKSLQTFMDNDKWGETKLERPFVEGEGFASGWPKKMTTETFLKKFSKSYPNVEAPELAVLLLAIWISGRIPES
jgi:hypothetical protein